MPAGRRRSGKSHPSLHSQLPESTDFWLRSSLKMHSLGENKTSDSREYRDGKKNSFFLHGWMILIPWSEKISWKIGFWRWSRDGVGVSGKNRRGFWRIWREEVGRGQEPQDSTEEYGQRRESVILWKKKQTRSRERALSIKRPKPKKRLKCALGNMVRYPDLTGFTRGWNGLLWQVLPPRFLVLDSLGHLPNSWLHNSGYMARLSQLP